MPQGQLTTIVAFKRCCLLVGSTAWQEFPIVSPNNGGRAETCHKKTTRIEIPKEMTDEA